MSETDRSRFTKPYEAAIEQAALRIRKDGKDEIDGQYRAAAEKLAKTFSLDPDIVRQDIVRVHGTIELFKNSQSLGLF